MTPVRAPKFSRHGWAIVVFGVSLLFSLARVPHATWKKRIGQVHQFEELGALGYHVGRSWPKIEEVALWIRANTPENAIVLWRGHWKGPIELLVASVGNRLFYEEARWGRRAEILGRPVARGAHGDRASTLVVVANGAEIALEFVP